MAAETSSDAPTTTGNGVGADARIVLDHVSHSFVNRQTGEAVHAVDDASLMVEADELLTVVGPSGCGKSTLLKAVAGLIQPTSGTIWCNGRKVDGPGRDRGMVFQDLAILPWRTVWRNIGHGLEIQRMPKRERDERVGYFVDLMGLRGFEHAFPHELSGGMKQRVAVARTWASDPDVILMDEPFAAVDAQTRLTLQEELLRISLANAKTLLFITHHVEEAVFLGDRVVVMSRRPGRIKEIVQVPIPRAERDIAALTGNPEVTAVSNHVLQLVRAEVE